MLGDFSTHSSVGPPQPVPPDGGAVQQAADEFPPRLQRTLDLRLAPDQLAALVEIHRAVAGHLDRTALFTAVAHSLMAERAEAWSGVPPILLEEIAASIAVAVDHCAAYEELGRLRDEQEALLEINRTVARHLHRDELFATLAQCLRDVLPSDRFGIELPVAGDKLRAYVLATRNAKSTPVQVEELPSAGTACRWTEETRQWLIASSREEVRERFPVTFDVMKREGMQSVCAIPLLSGERSR